MIYLKYMNKYYLKKYEMKLSFIFPKLNKIRWNEVEFYFSFPSFIDLNPSCFLEGT